MGWERVGEREKASKPLLRKSVGSLTSRRSMGSIPIHKITKYNSEMLREEKEREESERDEREREEKEREGEGRRERESDGEGEGKLDEGIIRNTSAILLKFDQLPRREEETQSQKEFHPLVSPRNWGGGGSKNEGGWKVTCHSENKSDQRDRLFPNRGGFLGRTTSPKIDSDKNDDECHGTASERGNTALSKLGSWLNDPLPSLSSSSSSLLLSSMGSLPNTSVSQLKSAVVTQTSTKSRIPSRFGKGKSPKGCKSVFGISLSELFDNCGSPVPYLVIQCIEYLKSTESLCLEGIFRVSGKKDLVENLIVDFQSPSDIVPLHECVDDPHIVSSMMKRFYRDLPEPLFTFSASLDVYKMLQEIPQSQEKERINGMCKILKRLPPINSLNARFLFEFLNVTTLFAEESKMTFNNLAIVWGPNLFRVADPSTGFNHVLK